MTVYPSADHADIWASFKHGAHDNTTSTQTAPVIDRGPLSPIERQCFDLIDDLDRICYQGCVLYNADIGTIQAKLQILRLNLNAQLATDTQHKQARSPQSAPDPTGPATQEPAPVPAAILDQPLNHGRVELVGPDRAAAYCSLARQVTLINFLLAVGKNADASYHAKRAADSIERVENLPRFISHD